MYQNPKNKIVRRYPSFEELQSSLSDQAYENYRNIH